MGSGSGFSMKENGTMKVLSGGSFAVSSNVRATMSQKLVILLYLVWVYTPAEVTASPLEVSLVLYEFKHGVDMPWSG